MVAVQTVVPVGMDICRSLHVVDSLRATAYFKYFFRARMGLLRRSCWYRWSLCYPLLLILLEDHFRARRMGDDQQPDRCMASSGGLGVHA